MIGRDLLLWAMPDEAWLVSYCQPCLCPNTRQNRIPADFRADVGCPSGQRRCEQRMWAVPWIGLQLRQRQVESQRRVPPTDRREFCEACPFPNLIFQRGLFKIDLVRSNSRVESGRTGSVRKILNNARVRVRDPELFLGLGTRYAVAAQKSLSLFEKIL